MDGKYEFKYEYKYVPNIELRNIVMFLVLYVLLTVGILLNRYLGDLFLVSLKK